MVSQPVHLNAHCTFLSICKACCGVYLPYEILGTGGSLVEDMASGCQHRWLVRCAAAQTDDWAMLLICVLGTWHRASARVCSALGLCLSVRLEQGVRVLLPCWLSWAGTTFARFCGDVVAARSAHSPVCDISLQGCLASRQGLTPCIPARFASLPARSSLLWTALGRLPSGNSPPAVAAATTQCWRRQGCKAADKAAFLCLNHQGQLTTGSLGYLLEQTQPRTQPCCCRSSAEYR